MWLQRQNLRVLQALSLDLSTIFCTRCNYNIPRYSKSHMQDPNCVFCKIVAGEIPARVLVENDRAVALLDAFPLAAGHTLVIPKAHYAKVQDMNEQDAMAVFGIAWKVVGAVETASQVPASTIAIHNGKEAGQEVPHVHVHIVPRTRNDGAGPIHSMFKNRPKLGPQEMDSLRDKIISGNFS